MIAFRVLKYVAVGFLIWLLAGLFTGGNKVFVKRSEPVMLVVVDMQTKPHESGFPYYRPIFALQDAVSVTGHAGGRWQRFAPHQIGDIVPGRYDAERGEMQSDKMLEQFGMAGWFGRMLGIAVALQAVALLFGMPEERLPLRIRVGHRRQRRIGLLLR